MSEKVYNEYKTITSADEKKFDQITNELSKEGWNPTGPATTPSYYHDQAGHVFVYAQQWTRLVYEAKHP